MVENLKEEPKACPKLPRFVSRLRAALQQLIFDRKLANVEVWGPGMFRLRPAL